MTASATPILDREIPVPPPSGSPPASAQKSRRNQFMWGLLILSPAMFVAFFEVLPKRMIQFQAPLFVLYLVSEFVLALFLAIVIHELGHVIAGWCAGLRLFSVRFGPIELTRRGHVSFSGDGSLTGGLTRMLPTSTKGLRVRVFVMTLGGCTANLLSAAAVLFLVPNPSFFLIWFVIVSILVGIGNLMPFQRDSLYSDGKRIWVLFRPDASSNRSLAMVKIMASLRKGLSEEDIPPALISAATSVVDNSLLTFLAHRTAYAASWQKGSETETARLLEITLRHSGYAPTALREPLFSDAGAFQAQKRQNLELARQWLGEISPTPSPPWARLWLEAAILEVQKDFQGALLIVNEIVATMEKRSLERPIPKSLQRWREELREKLNELQPASTTST